MDRGLWWLKGLLVLMEVIEGLIELILLRGWRVLMS